MSSAFDSSPAPSPGQPGDSDDTFTAHTPEGFPRLACLDGSSRTFVRDLGPAPPDQPPPSPPDPSPAAFGRFLHGIASHPGLTPTERNVAMALLHWAWHPSDHCEVSDWRLADYVGVSEPTVRRALTRLEGLGLIRRDDVPYSAKNMTGRSVVLLWISDPSRVPPPPLHNGPKGQTRPVAPCNHRSPAIDPPDCNHRSPVSAPGATIDRQRSGGALMDDRGGRSPMSAKEDSRKEAGKKKQRRPLGAREEVGEVAQSSSSPSGSSREQGRAREEVKATPTPEPADVEPPPVPADSPAPPEAAQVERAEPDSRQLLHEWLEGLKLDPVLKADTIDQVREMRDRLDKATPAKGTTFDTFEQILIALKTARRLDEDGGLKKTIGSYARGTIDRRIKGGIVSPLVDPEARAGSRPRPDPEADRRAAVEKRRAAARAGAEDKARRDRWEALPGPEKDAMRAEFEWTFSRPSERALIALWEVQRRDWCLERTDRADPAPAALDAT